MFSITDIGACSHFLEIKLEDEQKESSCLNPHMGAESSRRQDLPTESRTSRHYLWLIHYTAPSRRHQQRVFAYVHFVVSSSSRIVDLSINEHASGSLHSCQHVRQVLGRFVMGGLDSPDTCRALHTLLCQPGYPDHETDECQKSHRILGRRPWSPIVWFSKMKGAVALSITQAEFNALAAWVKEVA